MTKEKKEYRVVNVSIQTQPAIQLEGEETVIGIEEALVKILNEITQIKEKLG